MMSYQITEVNGLRAVSVTKGRVRGLNYWNGDAFVVECALAAVFVHGLIAGRGVT
jgi:hypothetical protein